MLLAQQFDASKQQVAELNVAMREMAQKLQTAQLGSDRKRPNFDMKAMTPEIFNDQKGAQSFIEFAEKVKTLIGLTWPNLVKAMDSTERQDAPVTEETLSLMDVDESSDNHLRALLVLRAGGEAFGMVKLARRMPGLEQWRQLARHFDPLNGTRNLEMSTRILNPAKAKKLEDATRIVQAWEMDMHERFIRTGKVLDEDDL